LPSVCNLQYVNKLFKAAFSVAFHCLLRIDELAINNGCSRHVLLISNLAISNDHLKLKLSSSKTDQLHEGSELILQRRQGHVDYPWSLVIEYINSRQPLCGQLYCHVNGTPLTRTQFVFILKKCLLIIGIDSKRYSSHSFRIGAATNLAVDEASDGVIRNVGRWI
jgi:hypothetical protein